MRNPLDLIAREPVMAAVLAVVGATVALLVAFGVHVTADQREAIEGWVGALLALGLVVRSQVTPTAKLKPEAVAPVEPAVEASAAPVATTPATHPATVPEAGQP